MSGGGGDDTGGSSGMGGGGRGGMAGVGGSNGGMSGSAGFAGGGAAGAGMGGAGMGGAGMSGAGMGGAGMGGGGGSGGITTCVGAPDPSCSCLKVTRDGNDAEAIASAGSTPFRTVQAAIDFAGSAPNVPVKVCVAGFDTCASATEYAAPRMRDGVSVYGSYASATWTRCTPATTGLGTTVAEVRFGSDITHETVLDGFEVGPTAIPASISVVGARNAVLSNIVVLPGATRGIDISGGADVRIQDSRVSNAAAAGVRATSSRVLIERTTVSSSMSTPLAPLDAVVLDAAVGSHIETSTLTTQGGTVATALNVTGDATGVEVRSSTLRAENGSDRTATLSLESCGGASPLIQGNPSITALTTARTPVDAIRSLGDCHPRILDNGRIGSSAPVGAPQVTGIHCGTDNACVIARNLIRNTLPSFRPGDMGEVTGIFCEAGACASIAENDVMAQEGVGCINSCSTAGYGVRLFGSTALVDRNIIVGGCMSGSATGLLVQGGSPRVVNNRITATTIARCLSVGGSLSTAYGVQVVGMSPADIHSNTIEAGAPVGNPTLAGIAIGSSDTVIRNNILYGGVRELSIFTDPSVFENNLAGFYYDEGTTLLFGAAAINALTDMTVSGTIDQDPQFVSYPTDIHIRSTSPCRNAGTATGAPTTDMDGETRSAPFDIGADEWSQAHEP